MKFLNFNSSFKSQLLTAICVNIITFSHGAVLGWLSPFIPFLQSDQSPLNSGPITVVETSWIGSLICVGGLTGNFCYGYIAEKWGRKISLVLLVFPQFAFWVTVIFATKVYHLYIARIFAGTTGGGLFVVIPLYIAGIAEPNIRGTLGSVLLLTYNFGILFSYIMGLYLDYYTFPYLMLLFPIIFFFIFIYFPETPQFLLEKNKFESAEKSLKFYRGIKKDEPITKIILEELDRMKTANTIKFEENSKLTLQDFKSKEAIHGLSIGVFLMILNQFSGGFAIVNYSARIFQDSGTNIEPRIASIVVASLQILGAYGSTVLADRAGRKILLIISSVGTCLGLAIMGTYSYLSENGIDVTSFQIVPVISLSFVIFIASVGVLTLPFVILAEVLPTRIRPIGSTISMSVLTLASFFVLKFFPILSETLHLYGCMWLFSCGCFFGIIFIIFVVPETNGKILDDGSKKKSTANASDI